MKLSTCRAALPLACAIALGGCSTHTGRPDIPAAEPTATVGVSVVHNVIYTPPDWPQPLTADLYRPEGAGPFPAVVMIHGGGWERRTRADTADLAETVAQRGYVVMNVSYRFAPAWHFPAQLNDVQQALLWLRAHADEHSVRADRVATWGYSAGAHLATLVGTTGPGDRQFVDGSRVQAVVGGGTPVDLRVYPDGRLVKALMGVSLTEDGDLWRDASPIAFASADDPPVFLYHGTFDMIVGDDNARTMFETLGAAGVHAELYLARGQGHISTFLLDSPVDAGIEFLDRQLR